MRQYNRVIACLLAILLLINPPLSASAAEPNTPKEEVVYINLHSDGSVKEIYVVNIFDLTEDGQIVDYGAYETLRNMTTTDAIGYSDNTVTIDTSAGKLYYEGKFTDLNMPWDIDIHYYLDGQEYSAEDLAGQSGALRITMAIRQNAECDSSFFEGYALQATFVLDTPNCKNIVADGATVANVGSDKQLTYTILPNKGADIEITADVTDFEMDGIAINGVQLNLDVEIDDAELQDKINEIKEAVADLDDGAKELHDGAGDLYQGTEDLYNGTNDLYEGAGSLKEGTDTLHGATETLNEKVGELHTGVGTLVSGADTLYAGLATLSEKNSELTGAAWSAYEALCSAAQTQLNAQLTANGLDEVTLTPATYSDVLMNLLAQMDADVVYQQAYNAALAEVTAQVEAQADALYQGYITSQADTIYAQYVASQLDPSLPDDQKAQIISATVAQMTDAQKEQILQSALASLTDDQKTAIRTAYIEQMMASDSVTQQISAATGQVSASAAQIAQLKAQLDNYGVFYQGLASYTTGVAEAAAGANTLQEGLDTLYSNTETLKSSVSELHSAVGELQEGSAELNSVAKELNDGAKELNDGAKELHDGTKELTDGTGEFADETSDMDTQVSDEIDSMVSSLSGKDVETLSFVSAQNTNIKAVQFVIKTDAIQVDDDEDTVIEEEAALTFWQKLLRLFKLY